MLLTLGVVTIATIVGVHYYSLSKKKKQEQQEQQQQYNPPPPLITPPVTPLSPTITNPTLPPKTTKTPNINTQLAAQAIAEQALLQKPKPKPSSQNSPPPPPQFVAATSLPPINMWLVMYDQMRGYTVWTSSTDIINDSTAPVNSIILTQVLSSAMYRIQFNSFTNLYLCDVGQSTAQLSTKTDMSSVWKFFTTPNNTCSSSSYCLQNVGTGNWLGVGTSTADTLYCYNQTNASSNLCFSFKPAPSSLSTTSTNVVPTQTGPAARTAQIGNNTNYIEYVDQKWSGYSCGTITDTDYNLGNNQQVGRINMDQSGNKQAILTTCTDGSGHMQGTLVPAVGWTAYQNQACPTCPNAPGGQTYDDSWQQQAAQQQAAQVAAAGCQPCPPGWILTNFGDHQIHCVPTGTAYNYISQNQYTQSKNGISALLHSVGVPPWPNECATQAQTQQILAPPTANVQPTCAVCPPGWQYDPRNGFDKSNPGASYCVPVSSTAIAQNKQLVGNNGNWTLPDGRTANEIFSELVNPGFISNWANACL